MALAGLLIASIIPFEGKARLASKILITMPLGILGLIGIDGDYLSIFLVGLFRWCRHRKPYLYNNHGNAVTVTPADLTEQTPFVVEKVREMVAKVRRSSASQKHDYREGENFRFADDPQMQQLQTADRRNQKTAAKSKETPATEDVPEQSPGSISSKSLDLDDLIAGRIPLSQDDNPDKEG